MPLDAAFYGFASVGDARSAWLEQLERVATAHIEAGVIIDDLLPSAPATQQVFATTPDSRSALIEAYKALCDGTETSVWWSSVDGTWHELKAPLTDDLSAQATKCVIDYMVDCQARWKALAASIAAAGSADAVLAIDLSSGWPSRTCAGGFAFGDDFKLAFRVPGVPDADEILFAYSFDAPAWADAQFGNCKWGADVAATASTAITIKLNGTTLATATYGAASATATVTGMTDPQFFAEDDVLTFHAPATPDATLAGIRATLPMRF